jgi:hypothetical protein
MNGVVAMSLCLGPRAVNGTDIQGSSSLTAEEGSPTSALTNGAFIRNRVNLRMTAVQSIFVTREQASENKNCSWFVSFAWQYF